MTWIACDSGQRNCHAVMIWEDGHLNLEARVELTDHSEWQASLYVCDHDLDFGFQSKIKEFRNREEAAIWICEELMKYLRFQS